MTEIDMSEYIRTTQQAAQSGMPPHAILRVLLDRFKLVWPDLVPRVQIEICLAKAFNVPLRTARGIEPWKGFSSDGTATDQDIDVLLSPWITQYLCNTSETV